jgi:hypothetical protein
MNYLFLQDSTFVKPTVQGFINRIKDGINIDDLGWMVFFTGLTFLLYKVATLNIHDERKDWTRILLYFAICGGLLLAYFTFGYFEVAPLAPTSYIIMSITFLILTTTLLLYARIVKDFAKITNGVVIIIIGFLMVYSVIIDRLGYAYSFAFSLTFAIAFARMVLSTTLFPTNPKATGKTNSSKYKGGNNSSV